jgi:hypothetical protein
MTRQRADDARVAWLATAWRVVAGLAVALIAFLAVGFYLPGTWTTERSARIPAAPEAVFPLLDDLRQWERWTPWPDLEARVDGPQSGVGARRSWDDPEYGDGVLTIVEVTHPSVVRYEVLVEGGSIRIDGSLLLEPHGLETVVRWTESGDFGWNPLLAYMALAMDRIQGTELEKGLERLVSAVEEDSLGR